MPLSTMGWPVSRLIAGGAAAGFVMVGTLTGCGIAKQAIQNATNRLAHSGSSSGNVDASQLIEGAEESESDIEARPRAAI